MESDTGSIYELLQMIKHLKQQPNSENKLKDLSSLSFSDKYQSLEAHHRMPFSKLDQNADKSMTEKSMTKKSINNSTLTRASIFDKLYHEGKEIQQRKCRLQYETRKSKEQKQQQQCTFSPNIRSRNRIRTEYDSVDQNDSFYIKNMQWQERKQKSIKVKQCQKNEGNVNELTFTPRINKYKKKIKDKENKVIENKGVKDFIYRQNKAKKLQNQVEQKKKNPYLHIWNVKKGHFSYIK